MKFFNRFDFLERHDRNRVARIWRSAVGLLLLSLLALAQPKRGFSATFSDDNWLSMGGFPGADGLVRAMVVDSSSNLYIGGVFSAVAEVAANGIAKWDGTNWSALSSTNGIEWHDVTALAVSGSNVYAAGLFMTTRVDGTPQWESGVVKWDGSSWSVLGTVMTDPCCAWLRVHALAVLGSDLYAAGDFATVGGIAASIAKWDGTNWSALGSGIDGGVSALAVLGSDLYAGGWFTTAGGIVATHIAKWDGTNWSAMGSGISGGDVPQVSALAVSGNDLYVGGYFTMAGGIAATNIAKWDGTNWSALGSGLNGNYRWVHALAVSGGDVYAAVFVATKSEHREIGIAKWDGSSWSDLGLELSGGSKAGPNVFALAVLGGELYAGGYFTAIMAGGTAWNFVKWDGSSWSALGSGIGGYSSVNALAVSGNDLYVGGSFTMTGGIAATNIAKWDGSRWSPLSSGLGRNDGEQPRVEALAVSGSDRYVGGYFTMAGGIAATNIAKWDGDSWSALEGSPYVHALAVSGSDLYAAGTFTTAGGIAATNIAKWDGTNWSALGSGISGGDVPQVFALAVSGSVLYAGGAFTTAGGIAARNVAKWDGTRWSALGSGLNGNYRRVHALAVSGGDLYAAGTFTTAGGIAANHIAKWDGTRWSALGSGLNGGVYALAVSVGDLYAGGDFITAGGKVSPYLARAVIARPANVISSFRIDEDFLARFDGTPGATYTIEYADTLPTAIWRKAINITAPNVDQGMGVGVFEFRDSTANAPQRFYRAVYPSY